MPSSRMTPPMASIVGFRPIAATSGPPISGPTSDAPAAVALTIASVRPR